MFIYSGGFNRCTAYCLIYVKEKQLMQDKKNIPLRSYSLSKNSYNDYYTTLLK